MNPLPILCLAGPTAAGKTASTLALAKRWPIEIINVDSATIYREMDIGTAKPTPAEQALVPQHLLDIRDPAESYSAADFCTDATTLIDQILARGRIPLLCGGTMMYYKALREGLNDLPQADQAVRAELEADAKQLGWPALHARLAEVDPATAARLAPNDSQRIQRALEIWRLSGQPMSVLLQQQKSQPVGTPRHFITLSLEPSDRLALHRRIALRYELMLEQGLMDEVERLYARGDLHPGLPSIRCVGYRQLWDYLDGKTSKAQAIEQAIAATRQLAKRQLTWLRAQPDRQIIDCLAPDVVAQVLDAAMGVWSTPYAHR
ncbi:tRNA (adenosine(37)-N6)-dimethylallyltransferase MiaA [Pusillimonas sp. NJUB218]|uniref:tRNA (adenosine(37)-N6)-dimethylallyltransferase MiaA n=1 Tax=Pusillimonas sp. NJUB218 TaxID=2023230 RepID=UPI000F4D1709|nr:tRNA (adenosine(37)-N6)-dimethylallyltransferase MiaA [Pusillimonas sp. NJUB218]ROT45947.1 tRNA (adenosine(37)-N6)-dimethylallyltransferase MiaA [Pusillimonas sp. NJUB218]